MTIVTKDRLQAMLELADEAKQSQIIGRALVVLFKRQTESEKMGNTVEEHNNIGFTGTDGRSGCIGAKYYLKHGMMKDWMIEKWMHRNAKGYSRIVKYHKQLNEAAMLKRDRVPAEV